MRTTLISETRAARRVVSAADFGAAGNGVTDDTAALQNALNAIVASGSVLLLAPGKYKVSRTLHLALARQSGAASTGISAYGATLVSSIKTSGPVLHVSSTATAHQVVVEGLEIDGGSRARGRDISGLVLEAVTAEGLLHNVCLRDVSVDRCSGDGCHVSLVQSPSSAAARIAMRTIVGGSRVYQPQNCYAALRQPYSIWPKCGGRHLSRSQKTST